MLMAAARWKDYMMYFRVRQIYVCNIGFTHTHNITYIYLKYMEFRRRMQNFACHNKRFEQHYYVDSLGRAHCRETCQLCLKKDKEIQAKVTLFLESCIDLDSLRIIRGLRLRN